MKIKRSPLFYVGDKYKLMEQIGKKFPKEIDRLIEPFCGGGSVFLNTQAKSYFANDLNKNVIQIHKLLNKYKNKRLKFFEILEKTIAEYNLSASYLGETVPAEIKSKYKKTYFAVYNKKSYEKLKIDFNNDRDPLKLYMLLVYGFNHMIRFNSNNEFNLPVGNVDYNKNVVAALNNYFDFIESSKIYFKALDYKKFLNEFEYSSSDLVYLDPPYLISSSEYNKFWDEKKEEELLEVLDKLNEKGVKFALSNVIVHKDTENKLLKKWAKKYNVYKVKSNYISYHNNSKKRTLEVLITNFEEKCKTK